MSIYLVLVNAVFIHCFALHEYFTPLKSYFYDQVCVYDFDSITLLQWQISFLVTKLIWKRVRPISLPAPQAQELKARCQQEMAAVQAARRPLDGCIHRQMFVYAFVSASRGSLCHVQSMACGDAAAATCAPLVFDIILGIIWFNSLCFLNTNLSLSNIFE